MEFKHDRTYKVPEALKGLPFDLKRSPKNTYDGTDMPFVFLRFTQEDKLFEGASFLVLSKTAAENFNKVEADKQLDFLSTLEVAWDEESELWGIHMPDQSITLAHHCF